MKEIKCLYTNIRDEMEDAEKYASLALKYKDGDRELADTFESLSKQEATHAEALHAEAVRLIKDYRSRNGEPPESMKAVYDWEHERMIGDMADVKRLHELYRG